MASILETAKLTASLSVFVKAVKIAGLVDTFDKHGPFTVFAPSDEAFSKIDPDKLKDLLADVAKLQMILLYHVLRGEYMAEDVIGNEGLRTCEGQRLIVDVSRGIKINEAQVTQTDIECDNGVIHIIDTVLYPRVRARLEI